MKTSFIISSVAALLLSSSMALASTYKVDTAHSGVEFKIKHMMISNVKGNFKTFDGSFDFDNGQITAINGSIDVASIDTDNEKRDAHLTSSDFFDATNNPKMTFKAISVHNDKVIGALTIKGITKEVTFDLEVGGAVKDPWGNQRAGLTLTGTIDREDFGLTWNKALETGGVVVGKKVTLVAELEGILAQ